VENGFLFFIYSKGEKQTMITAESIFFDVQKIRSEAPLIHNITNYVAMNTTANALLSIGASPVMAHAIEEVAEMASIAQALVINIGTLSQPWIESMIQAAKAAKKKNIPIILDPVGAGATKFRTDTAHRLLVEAPPAIIRGNASEIRALYHAEGTTKGVDSTYRSDEAVDAAKALSKQYNCVVSVSGEVDVIIENDRCIRIHNGHPLMPKVTGLGCTASALTGAFAAVNPSPIVAATHAMAVMGIAGEIAAKKAKGPGTLQLYFLDALYQLQEADIKKRLRVEQ